MISNLQLQLAALPFPNIDPVALSVGPLQVHWYGLAYVVGLLFAWWYTAKLAATPHLWKDDTPPFTPDDAGDFLTWATIGVIAGGRLGYVFFYDAARIVSDPLSIFAVWEGGMSFHGGILGVTIAMILFARTRKISMFSLFDGVAAGVPIALGLVRITNFINAELWGRTTDHPWGVIFPNGGPLPRHPSQLYEAFLEGFALFISLIIMVWVFKALKKPGLVAGIFVMGYGLSRIAVEFVREPDAHIGYLVGNWMTMGMVLSTPMVVIGLWSTIRALKNARS